MCSESIRESRRVVANERLIVGTAVSQPRSHNIIQTFIYLFTLQYMDRDSGDSGGGLVVMVILYNSWFCSGGQAHVSAMLIHLKESEMKLSKS